MIVRGYYEVYVSDEEVDINNKEEVIERAKTLFDYDIQDRCVHSNNMTFEIMEQEEKIWVIMISM